MKPHLRALPPSRTTSVALARSTLLVMALSVGSALLGFAREVANARFYGADSDLDAFLAAATIPTILFGVFNGALLSALIPTFSETIERDGEESAWRLAGTICAVITIALAALAVAGYVLAPWYVPVIAHGFAPPKMALTIHITQWLMPTVVFTSLAGVASAMLNARHQFFAPALGGVAINIVTIFVVTTFARSLGIEALVIGTAAGLVAQLLVQLPAIVALRMFRPALDFSHPGLPKMFAMLGPIVVGSAAGQAALFFDRFFASTLSSGYIAGMNYAIKLVGFPQQIFATAVATVIFPLLASQFAASNKAGVKRSIVTGLRLVNLVTIPAVVGLIVLRRPIVEVLFERGAFKSTATDLCAGLLPFAAIGLVGVSASIVLTRCSFACKEVRWTVIISVFTVVLNVVLAAAMLGPLGARGLLLAGSVSQCVGAVLMFALVWRLTGGLDWRTIADSALRIVACSLLMMGALEFIARFAVRIPPTFGTRAAFLAGELVIATFVFLGAARLLRVEELPMTVRLIVAKFQSRTPGPPENLEAPIA